MAHINIGTGNQVYSVVTDNKNLCFTAGEIQLKVNTVNNFSVKFVLFEEYTEAITIIIRIEFMIMVIHDVEYL